MVLILERKRQDRISGLKETNRILTVEQQRKIGKKKKMNRASDSGGIITKKPTFTTGIPEEEDLEEYSKKITIKNKSFSSFIDTTYRFKIQEAEWIQRGSI